MDLSLLGVQSFISKCSLINVTLSSSVRMFKNIAVTSVLSYSSLFPNSHLGNCRSDCSFGISSCECACGTVPTYTSATYSPKFSQAPAGTQRRTPWSC